MKHPLAFLALVAAVDLAAQPTAPLSIEDCRRIAADQQPAIAAARAGVTGAQAAIGEARAPYLPQIDLSAGYHRWQRRAFLPSGLSIPGRPTPDLIGPLDDWNGGLSSRLTVYDFGERSSTLTAAKARARGAEADARAAQADVKLGVDNAFYTLAGARELQGVAEKNLDRTQHHRGLAIARRDAGAVPQADVLRLEAELANARLQLITAQSRVRIAAGQLNTAMGRPAETPIDIKADLDTPPPANDELGVVMARALAQRPELVSSEKRAEAAKAALSGAKASRAPKVRADASYGWRDTGFWPDTKEWQAGLSLDLPVFDGGSRANRVARSKADVAREEALLEQRRLQIRNEVWAAMAELQRAWASIEANVASVRASEESLRVVSERYERGAAVVTDLLDTQTSLARAESSLAEARWSYSIARASFDRAVGAAPQDNNP